MEPPAPVVIDPAGRDIHAEAARIRANGPVSRIELPGGALAWSITDHELARQSLADHRFSKDPRKHWTDFAEGRIGEDFPLIGWVLMDNLTTSYGPDHTRLRRLTSSAFTPRRVEAMRAGVEKAVADLLDELDSCEPGEVVDLKARFAHPVPARVICDLFGVPAEERAHLLRGGEVNVDTTITPEESAANVEQWHREMQEFIDAKRRNPGDDLTSDLVQAQEEDGSRLTDSELVGTLHLLLATGTEPVMNLLANATRALLTHPAQLALLRSGAVSWSDVIEETLRAEAPVAHLPFRFAVEDIELGGVTIAKGEPVLINFAAVGRDRTVHGESADTFDATRPGKEHLSFGHGVYRCIGMPLARMEAEIALSALFGRFPDLELAVPAEDLAPQVTFIMNGVQALPVRLTPQAR
ncbi:cytochrome P450 family protein [Saccharothrix sp. ST-888]|uniref:cytochrome P450 family protein n=1 Tax=Saccharothrix sp. ST-888 TaxID=1427391 RepID=UPI0005ECCAAB|nr:cytochrome P450 [Saccharothrix sp. ST-888]KJK58364.1 cytochrome P450 [Saccharothrix sp. ST-888]